MLRVLWEYIQLRKRSNAFQCLLFASSNIHKILKVPIDYTKQFGSLRRKRISFLRIQHRIFRISFSSYLMEIFIK